MKTVIPFIGSSVLVCALLLVPINTTHAQLTRNDMNEQALVVQEHVVSFLEEYVKFLQMELIVKLQQRVALLKATIGNKGQ